MTWDPSAAVLLLLLLPSCFPREKTTENPEMPRQRRPTHISEFTDPDTGLNPFLDLEEGIEGGRANVMEDERTPFGFDLVEGDATDRRWDLDPPPPHPKPDAHRNSGAFHVATTPSTTFVEVETASEEDAVETRPKVKKEEQGSSLAVLSQSTVIYASSAVAVLTAAALLVGIWWRRKLKTPRSSTAAAGNGDVKS